MSTNLPRRLEGKNVLITGAGTGIGEAIAIRFAEEGANVAINYFHSGTGAQETEARIEAARKVLKEQGGHDLLIQANVSDEEDVKRMFATVLRSWARLDILVNNAGIQKAVPSQELTLEDFNRVLDVDLRGTFLCSREAIRHYLSRPGGGVIVNDSSVHERIPKPLYLSYAVSKGGIERLTKTLALEFAGRGIRVNAVGPGAIITPINRAWINDPKKKAEVEGHIPMGRAGTPEEMAAVFAFLASDDASYVTGQTLFADGGLTLYPEFRTAWSSGP
ncbi:MAG TPA: SDR family oxidoreductase [Thermoplasmata archaeon]|nr:SDR family oxidoreductase [Thermoplasmata archaeon]